MSFETVKKWLSALIIQCIILTIWSTYYLEKKNNLNDININLKAIPETQNECNIDLNSILTFGPFYGIPLYYKKNGYLSHETKSNAILSIATMCTIDRLSSTKQIATNFNGPISISIYIESLEKEIKHKKICNEIEKYFGDKFSNNKYDISISILYPDYLSTYYQHLNITNNNVPIHAKVPVNALRNLAVSQVYTKYISVFDVDFVYMSNQINLINDKLILQDMKDNKVWIIPSFQWKSSKNENKLKYLLDKNELLKLIKLNYIEPFYFEWKPGQMCTNYNQWYNATNNYEIKYCHFLYEPYIIFKTEYAQNQYKWDNNFIGRGYNKIQQIAFLAYNCFKFEVMHNTFIIHKYSFSNNMSNQWHPNDQYHDVMEKKYMKRILNTYCHENNDKKMDDENICIFSHDICNKFFSQRSDRLLPLNFVNINDTFLKNVINAKWKEYISTFYTNDVTMNKLKTLNDEILENKLKIKSKHYRSIILMAIEQNDGLYHNMNGNFKMIISEKYPFRKDWLFDYYIIKKIYIKKLNIPSLVIKGFRYKHKIFPFFNPSIIRIDNIPNYHNFMLSSISNLSQHTDGMTRNMEIIYKTTYILIGRWDDSQCNESDFQYDFNLDIDEEMRVSGSGLMLLDSNWNILQYVTLILNYDNQHFSTNSSIFARLQDCHLFNYISLVFTDCVSYSHNISPRFEPRNFIGPLLWKQDIIDNKLQIVAYLETKSFDSINSFGLKYSNLLKTRKLVHIPNNIEKFGDVPKNMVPLPYDKKLYFQWELKHSYFIHVNLFDDDKNGIIHGHHFHHNDKTFNLEHNINTNNIKHYQWSQNCGFIHLSESNEYLGIGHVHYNLYEFMHEKTPFDIQHGYHYTHYFYTINDKPPFYVKRISDEFCFSSPYILNNNKKDCDVIQFVNSIIQNTINNIDYLFISYGVND